MKLAIIGASLGQKPLCEKAKEMGVETICFAWEEGAICRDLVDKFFPISIVDKEAILSVCENECIDGVVSNASDLTAEIVSYISSKLSLHGNDYNRLMDIRNKSSVRIKSSCVNGLTPVGCCKLGEVIPFPYPVVMKPVTGAAKKGVVLVKNEEELTKEAENHDSVGDVIIEQYVEGNEFSVETISYEGHHYVLQITDKENTGAPHFVELAHHQPSSLPDLVISKVKGIVPNLLDAVGFENGASHIEMKVDANGKVYLIEINPRGGGDEISRSLVRLSTGYDYIKGMIDVALGQFVPPVELRNENSGIYYLCEQTSYLLPVFQSEHNQPWLVEKKYDRCEMLNNAVDNYSRDGYLIYQWKEKVFF